jgi:hypothetical protein
VGTAFHCGFSGGNGGNTFSDEGYPEGGRITEIHVWHGRVIDGFRVVYQDPGGGTKWMDLHGKAGPNPEVLTFYNESICAFGGRYGAAVDYIRFDLMGGREGPRSIAYGNERGGASDFHYEAPPSTEIIGFWGRSGDYIDAIGVLLRERT